ncbi:substrate-binding protein [Streptomyces mirabilis]|uniref:Substrate-binding protein n=1 Tax=Streptomyces mirabilis TaxID=68239 RepID=A0A1I2K0F7_9ACTN|nr:substrate-binding protein [Streptomyces mirabilis]
MSLNQGTTEIMLSLGLADRMAGTAIWTDPVMKGLEKANGKVPRLADDAPSFEKALDAEPDFVTASFASTLAKGDRASSSLRGTRRCPRSLCCRSTNPAC